MGNTYMLWSWQIDVNCLVEEGTPASEKLARKKDVWLKLHNLLMMHARYDVPLIQPWKTKTNFISYHVNFSLTYKCSLEIAEEMYSSSVGYNIGGR